SHLIEWWNAKTRYSRACCHLPSLSSNRASERSPKNHGWSERRPSAGTGHSEREDSARRLARISLLGRFNAGHLEVALDRIFGHSHRGGDFEDRQSTFA